MPDLNDLNNSIGGADAMTYKENAKLGAPELDPADMEDFLADTPAVWGGSEEKKGAPVVEGFSLGGGEAEWQEKKPAQPQPAMQPDAGMQDLLGDAPQVYDPVAEFCQKLQFDDNLKATFLNLPADKQQQVVEMRAGQLGISVPTIPKEMRPKEAEAEEAPAEEVMLEEAPKTEEYVPSFKDEDLERAKEESKKPQRYTPPPAQEMTEEQKKESLRMAAQLREEREREQAHKGFTQLIILTVVGIVGSVAFAIFTGCYFGLGFADPDAMGMMTYVKNYGPLLAIATGLGSLLLAAPIPQLKGVIKFLHGLSFILSLFPGIMMLIQKNMNTPVNGLLLGVAAVCFGVCVFLTTTSDSIHMYNKHGNS